MGVEDDIRSQLGIGYSAQELIQKGYRRSTVYKVHSSMAPDLAPVSPPAWWVDWQPDKRRYLPGEVASFRHSIKNTSGLDLYVYRSGIQPGWLKDGNWYVLDSRFLLRPGEARNQAITLPIRSDLALGEYETRWGLEAQFVGPGAPMSAAMTQTQWTEPFALEVKHPLSGYKVFISHSTSDMYLVRQLQQAMDNNGVEGVVAEDSKEPGVVLREKFEAWIRESHFLLALLTANGARSDWVIHETNYAHSIGKPCILLKEKETHVDAEVEYVEFSRYDPPEAIIESAQEALELLRQKRYGSATSANLSPLAIGIVAFLLGIAAGKSKDQQ